MTTTNKRPRRMAREPQAKASVASDKAEASSPTAKKVSPAARAKRPTKSETVLMLLKRPEGATLDELVAATGWLPHTTRAAMTGLKKKGHQITRTKIDGVSRYTAVDSAPQ
jgi:threonine dehydrogenase-like Zn-dependent dehydrogenase